MALTQRRRYSRKRLSQPDEFITFWARAAAWARENVAAVVITSVVAILCIAATSLWTSYRQKRAQTTTAMLSAGLKVMGADHAMATAKTGQISKKPSTKQDFAAAKEKFSLVIDRGKSTGAGRLAFLLRASASLKARHYDEAVSDFEAFLNNLDDDMAPQWKERALEGLVYAYEGKKDWQAAMKTTHRMKTVLKNEALSLYHQGRLLASQGKVTEAQQRYRRVIKAADSTTLVEKAGKQLAWLEYQQIQRTAGGSDPKNDRAEGLDTKKQRSSTTIEKAQARVGQSDSGSKQQKANKQTAQPISQ